MPTDIALTLDFLLPGSKYRGSLTENTQQAYNAITWLDERTKPTWGEIQAAANTAEIASKPVVELLDELIASGELQMANNPLPDDVQEQIYDLRTLVLTYPAHKKNLILRKVNAFALPTEGERPEITAQQRAIVANLKSSMLQLLN